MSLKTKPLLIALGILTSSLGFAQDDPTSNDEALSEEAKLAKATQNPLASMYSLPFQNNTTYGMGQYDRAQNVLNVQPVIPVSFKNFNLINRVIAPIITQPSSIEDKSYTGLGDINYTAWLSPSKESSVTWGAGPTFQIPTASEADEFGTREFGVGPSVVALTTINKWVAGVVVNNIWTFGDIEENKFLFQYFVNYNLPKAWYLVTGPIITANWNAQDGERAIVPFGGGAGKVFKLGKLPININAHLYYNAVKPDGVGNLASRIQLQLLFPK